VKDLCLARSLRHDLFIRGAQRLGGTDRNPALHEVVLLATVAEDEFKYEIEMAEGKAALQREFYGAVMAAPAAGPRSVGELLALPETASSTHPGSRDDRARRQRQLKLRAPPHP
jgi:hypothetical protein